MKEKTQHDFILRLFITVFLFTPISAVSGQEIVRQSVDYMPDTSIIRTVSIDSAMIFCKEESDSIYNVSRFVLATGNDNPYVMYLYNLYVNDFEIFERKVYLCGYTYDNEIRKAVFGYFNINQFPNCNIYCNILDDCMELKKLDIYKTTNPQFFEETHLVMTGGTTFGRSDVLVDIFKPYNAPFTGEIYISNNEDENFDDVAVTKNYVVVSSRNEENGIPLIYYMQFPKPGSVSQTIFSGNADIIRVSSPVANTLVLLEHTKDDKYASTYKNSGYSQIEMTLLEAPYTVISGMTIFGGLDRIVHPMDIKYNVMNNVYDILARDRFSLHDYVIDPQMQIYHITSNELNNISILGEGTKYPMNKLWSIDPHRFSFIASGSYEMMLRLYRYKHNQWNVCPQKFEYPYNIGKPEWKYMGTLKIYATMLYLQPETKGTEKETIYFPIKCEEE